MQDGLDPPDKRYLNSLQVCRAAHKHHQGVVMVVKNEFLSVCTCIDLSKYWDYSGIEIMKHIIVVSDFYVLLEPLFNELQSKYQNIIIVGDFNINFLNLSTSVQEITCILTSFNVDTKMSNMLTRVSGQTASYIDNILFNLFDDIAHASIFDLCL